MKPKKKLKVEELVVDGERGVRVSFGHFSFACIFLLVWLSGWTVGVSLLVRSLLSSFEWGLFFFAIPFVLAEIVVSILILFMLVGKTVITVSPSGGDVFTGVGRIGRRRAFSFPAGCTIIKDEYMTGRGKHGPNINRRVFVKSASDAEGIATIYSSMDFALVDELYDIVLAASGRQGVNEGSGASVEPSDDDALDAHDTALRTEPPPKHLTVTRDFEGRIHVVYRRIGWAGGIIILLVIALFSSVLYLMRHKEGTLPFFIFWPICMLFPLFQALYAFFGKKTMTLDHGQGVTFTGIGGVGVRKRFQYGGSYDVRLVNADMWKGSERMKEIVISKPGGAATKICASWPNEVKPHLAALLRHQDAASVQPSL